MSARTFFCHCSAGLNLQSLPSCGQAVPIVMDDRGLFTCPFKLLTDEGRSLQYCIVRRRDSGIRCLGPTTSYLCRLGPILSSVKRGQ